jgi:hypothetical protein
MSGSDNSPRHPAKILREPAAKLSPEEMEASKILDRVERELDALEKRTEKLMHQYGL